MISTVDPDTRHGHKTSARGFDGYKGHAAVDPDSEIITATVVTPGNAGDASVAEDLVADLLDDDRDDDLDDDLDDDRDDDRDDDLDDDRDDDLDDDKAGQDEPEAAEPQPAEPQPAEPQPAEPPVEPSAGAAQDAERACVYGDNAYGTGSFHDRLEQAGITDRCKTQTPTAAGGLFSKDRFDINLGADLGAGTVSCPGAVTAPIRPARAGGGTAYFASACSGCPLRAQCTTAAGGRTVSVGPYELTLTDARTRQTDPAWIADYRGTRPKVERKLGHLVRRHHGGRRAGSAAPPASTPTSGCWPAR